MLDHTKPYSMLRKYTT